MSKLNGDHSCLLILLQSQVLIEVKPQGPGETGIEWNPDYEYRNKSTKKQYFLRIDEDDLEDVVEKIRDILDGED